MTYIPPALGRLVIERSGNCCEYCRLAQAASSLAFHVEHIISEKHRGDTEKFNVLQY
jgi:hypothetical protein